MKKILFFIIITIIIFSQKVENKTETLKKIDLVNYELKINGIKTKTILLTPNNSSVLNIELTSYNEVEMYYKIAYLRDEDVDISYYETKDKPYGNIDSNETKYIRLLVTNNSNKNKSIKLETFNGYITKKINDIKIQENKYTEIANNKI